MHILNIVTSGLRREGITQTQLNYIKYINSGQNGKISFDILAVHDDAPDVIAEFESLGQRVVVLPDRKSHLFAYAWRLYRLIERENYDILHVHGSSSLLCIELFIAWLAGIKIRIAHSHNTKCDQAGVDQLLRPIFDRLYTDAFACGQEAGKWLFRERPFQVIPNGQELDRFRFDPEVREVMRTQYHWHGKIVLGHAGNFNDQKNQEYLVEIMEQLACQGGRDHYALCLMGDGENLERVHASVQEKGLTDIVIFTGRICNVPEFLQAMDLMLLPSLFEGLPNVVLEWQAAGLPCIVSDTVSRECAVTEMVTFLPLKLQREWVIRIQDFCPWNRAERSQSGREQLAAAGFDIRQNAGELRKLYFDLAKGSNKKNKLTKQEGGI